MKKVLIVEDDQTIRGIMKLDMEKYSNAFETVVAEDGIEATEMLKQHQVSLVVTDLKMPNMDGFALLGHILEQYPHIPVIIMTAYGTPKLKEAARNRGVVDFIDKPFTMEFLAEKILQSMQLESDGGTLHGISTGMFLQLIEMEQKTCTVRVMEKVTDRQGVLFFSKGVLLDATCEGLRREQAAYEIFSWEKVSISIQNTCPVSTKHIQGDLQGLLLEAMRRKDESSETSEKAIEKFRELDEEQEGSEFEEEGIGTDGQEGIEVIEEVQDVEEEIRFRLMQEVGQRCGLKDISHDPYGESVVGAVSELGMAMGSGTPQLIYMNSGESTNHVLLPREGDLVVAVESRAPRDRIINALRDF